MVAKHNDIGGGRSKRNPNPDMKTAREIRWWKSKEGKRERAEAVQSGSYIPKTWKAP